MAYVERRERKKGVRAKAEPSRRKCLVYINDHDNPPGSSGAANSEHLGRRLDLHQILAEGLDVTNHSAWADACATDIPD